MVGVDWLHVFLKRRNEGLRMPEATSLSRATSFNVINVFQFLDNFETVICRHAYEARQICNLDETGLTTVEKPGKLLTQKGLKQVGQITSAERGTLASLCCCINVVGHALPNAYIFARVNFRDHMIDGAPNGSLVLATKSGWINSELFLKVLGLFHKVLGLFHKVLGHLIEHMDVYVMKRGVLVMDNNESHMSVEMVEMAREKRGCLLSRPPTLQSSNTALICRSIWTLQTVLQHGMRLLGALTSS